MQGIRWTAHRAADEHLLTGLTRLLRALTSNEEVKVFDYSLKNMTEIMKKCCLNFLMLDCFKYVTHLTNENEDLKNQ